jgi:hypothetical protein
MKNIMFFLLIFCTVSSFYGQKNNPSHQIIPPTPDAASLGKYGDYPVSLATGLVDITIPLFEICTKRIKLPITLSYHTSGIKVEEIASSVGLGWVLNAGGCIAVTVKDKPDIVSSSYMKASSYIDNNLTNSYNNATLYDMGFSDNESDIYSYNFNGHSGQFYYNNKDEIIQLTKDGLQIERVGLEYKITTQDGILYKFKETELSYINKGQQAYSSIYYLNKIVDLMNGDEIIFSYKRIHATNDKNIIEYPYFNGLEIINVLRHLSDDNKLTVNISYPHYPEVIPSTIDIKTPSVLALSEITFSGGKVEIINDTDCEDVRVYRVARINLYSNLDNKNAIKTVEFNNSYFVNYTSSNSVKGKRLCLDGITIDKEKTYQFKYNKTLLPSYYSNGDGSTLSNSNYPTCLSQDEWGYYNAKPNKTLYQSYPDYITGTPGDTGIPGDNGQNLYDQTNLPHSLYSPANGSVSSAEATETVTSYAANGGVSLSSYAADRSSNPEAMKACSLEEIIYPTGGKTRFEFEANRIEQGISSSYKKSATTAPIDHYFNNNTTIVGGLRIKRILNYANKDDSNPVKITEYTYSGGVLPPLYETYKDWNNIQQYVVYKYENTISEVYECRDLKYYGTSPIFPNRFHNGNVVYYENVMESIYDRQQRKTMVQQIYL